MARMKKFLLYALIIAAFWIFSDILIYLSINSWENSNSEFCLLILFSSIHHTNRKSATPLH